MKILPAGLKKIAIGISPIVTFHGYTCEVLKKNYSGGGVALQLVAASDDLEKGVSKGEPIAVATINIPGIDLAPDEVVIKSYSENEGMWDALINSNIILDTGTAIRTNFITARIGKLMI